MEEAKPDVIIYPRVANIREEWHWVKLGIEEILHLDPNLTFRPEDVYASCVGGESQLWVHPNFFNVATIEVDEFTGDRTFLLWLSWAKERGGANAVAFASFYEDVARQCNCQRIETRSAQMPAVQYAVDKVGWEIKEIIFGKNLRS
jgi:hypothetical protein